MSSGNFIHLKRFIRDYLIRTGSSVDCEQQISYVHKIRSNSQRNQMHYTMLGHLIYIRSFYKNVDIENFSFEYQFYLAKNTFNMKMFRTYAQQKERKVPRKEYQANYYSNKSENIKERNRNSYRIKKETKINPVQGMAAPAPTLPPLPKKKKKKKKTTNNKRKASVKKVAVPRKKRKIDQKS